MYSFTDPAAPSRLHSRAARQSGRPVLHSTYRVLAGNISFPLTINNHQWQWKERNSCSKRNKNHATVKTEVTWFCVGNAACPPHTLRQACEEQGELGTAIPGSPLQTTATNMQMAAPGEHPWKQPAHTSTGLGSALLHRMASCPAAARNRSKFKLCLHDVMSGGCATQSSHSFLEVINRLLKKCVHVSGEQDICPTVRHSDWSNAKPMHKWTHSRLKPTKIQTVKKCPEHILRGSAKPLM